MKGKVIKVDVLRAKAADRTYTNTETVKLELGMVFNQPHVIFESTLRPLLGYPHDPYITIDD